MYGESQLNKNDGYNVGFVMTSLEGDQGDINLVGLFGGWALNKLRLGLEYNQYETDVTETLMSLYANYSISETLDVFVRNDMTEIVASVEDSDVTTSWIGVVCNPSKGLYISPNVAIQDDENNYRLTYK